MSWYYDSDPRADHARVLLEIKRRQKKGEPFIPVTCKTARGATSTTFWGRAWATNLESYADYETRLPRGRTYLRKGHVYDLELSPGYAFAYVAGSSLYEVEIKITKLPKKRWNSLKKSLSGKIDNLVSLLSGDLGPGVMEAVTAKDTGLFPSPAEIQIDCNCPDWAGLCKHAAAALYAVGIRFDADPSLLFKLRGIDHTELVAAASKNVASLTKSKKKTATPSSLKPSDLSTLFGIDLADPESAFPEFDLP